MEKYYTEKLKNLINLRINLVTLIIVLIGGLFGLHLLNLNKVLLISALIFWYYFSLLFLINMANSNNNITKILEELKNA